MTNTSVISHNPLPINNILFRSRLKTFADDNLEMAEKAELLEEVENIVGKEKKMLVTTIFSKRCFLQGHLTHYHTIPHFDAL